MKTVIVGGVAAGASTGARLRRLDESAEIVILERDHYVSFANCGLPYHIEGVIADRDSLLLQTPESLGAESGIGRADRPGRDPDRPRREGSRGVRRAAGSTVPGVLRHARAVLRGPNRSGHRSPGRTIPGSSSCATSRTWTASSRNWTRVPTSAVIVGGSYIGLELTEAFRTRGLHDDRGRAHREAHAMARPRDDADPRLPRRHARRGPAAWARPPTAVRRTADDRLVLDLSDGTSVVADVVVMAAGARPNVGLARDAGLEIGPRGGIVVDEQMRTSAPDILAAGDAVETLTS